MKLSFSGWIDESNIKPYEEHKESCKHLCKTAAFKEACEAIEQFIAEGEVLTYFINTFLIILYCVQLLFNTNLM